MTFTLDPIYLTNFILCITILVLGCLGYAKSKDKAPLFIGIGFALFFIALDASGDASGVVPLLAARATFRGSSESIGRGFPFLIAQNRQLRVQISPRMRKVAVP